MNPKEEKVFKETRLRNLKRKYSKLIQHADLTPEAEKLQHEITNLENQLS